MNSIELKTALRYFIKKSYIILIFIILFLSIGIYDLLINKDTLYKSSARIFYTGSKKTNINSYEELIRSRSIIESIRKSLSFDLKYNELSNNIFITIKPNYGLIEISAIGTSPKKAKEIVYSAESSLKNTFVVLYNDSEKNFKVIDEPSLPNEPLTIRDYKKNIILLSLSGFFLGCLIVFIMYDYSKASKYKRNFNRVYAL